MAKLFFILLIFLAINPLPSFSTSDTLSRGSSLYVEKPEDVLTSSDGVFTAGFHQVGNNSYCFAVWFTEPSPSDHHQNRTVVWMANRDQPVNGKKSKLTLLDSGNLILTDADQFIAWATSTTSLLPAQLRLLNSGNLLLRYLGDVVLWQSFDSPTDTLLPLQPFTRSAMLVSDRSQSNFSSGFYKLFFGNDNLLRLLFDGPEISSVYWPNPSRVSWDNARSTYNNSRTAMLNSLGSFSSSDNVTFLSADYGAAFQRRLRIDFDGNVRLYSREKKGEKWMVSWQAFSDPCMIHGICGANSLCSYDRSFGRECSCLPGYQMRNHTDWSFGCEPQFDLSYAKGNQSGTFLRLSQVEFNGYDFSSYPNYSYVECESICLNLYNCKGFQYTFDTGNGVYNCNPKTQLRSGHNSNSQGQFYLRLPKAYLISNSTKMPRKEFGVNCAERVVDLERKYVKKHVSKPVRFLLWIACGVGGFELFCLFLFFGLLSSRTRKNSNEDMQGYLLAATGFKRFSYAELKKATRGFSEEIGRGGGGVVYKGVLDDERVAAIKQLNEALQGEAEFLAEASTLGRLNHMNLIEMWGYCSEGKRKLLVYEYMEHGSLARSLSSNVLDWEKRFEIAVGTAKGLAYLHEECLEWVLHCDVKPQNILLDSNHQPKVADFGLSKMLNRGGEANNSSFSRIRGTRGYIAPEWVYNLPITSKVDVYSYGIVVLEMVTGKNPTMGVDGIDGERRRLVNWVREKVSGTSGDVGPQISEIIDPSFEGGYDADKMESLLRVALHCVEEDKDARPTMRQVVEMLLHGKDY